MQTYKTIITDDELTVRRQFIDVFKERDDVQLVAECASGEEAIDAINTEHPHLVFLKIELPEINAFDVIESTHQEYFPFFVLTSSTKDFALRAFEIEALDYIQTPFDSHRVYESLERLRKRLHNVVMEEQTEEIGNLIRDLQRPNNLERFIIKQAGEYHLVRASDILWIEADGNYSRIFTQSKKYMVRYTLSGFAEQLNSERFYRISRSQIVNLDYVVKIKDHIYGNYIVELNNGVTLKMSKNYKYLLETLKNF